MSVAIPIITILISFFVLGLMHELGHVIMYRIFCGDRNWKIVMGFGKPIIQMKRLTVNFAFFMGGYVTDLNFIKEPRKLGLIMFYAGGILVNIVFAIALLFLSSQWAYLAIGESLPEWVGVVIRSSFITSLFLIGFNVIPIPLKNIKTDGFLIFDILLSKNMDDYYKKATEYFKDYIKNDEK